jgi:hypothetical protein
MPLLTIGNSWMLRHPVTLPLAIHQAQKLASGTISQVFCDRRILIRYWKCLAIEKGVSQYSSVIIVTMAQSWRLGNGGLFLSRGKDQLPFRRVSGVFVLELGRLSRDHSSSCSSELHNKFALYHTSFSSPYIFTDWWLTLHLEKFILIYYIKL